MFNIHFIHSVFGATWSSHLQTMRQSITCDVRVLVLNCGCGTNEPKYWGEYFTAHSEHSHNATRWWGQWAMFISNYEQKTPDYDVYNTYKHTHTHTYIHIYIHSMGSSEVPPFVWLIRESHQRWALLQNVVAQYVDTISPEYMWIKGAVRSKFNLVDSDWIKLALDQSRGPMNEGTNWTETFTWTWYVHECVHQACLHQQNS